MRREPFTYLLTNLFRQRIAGLVAIAKYDIGFDDLATNLIWLANGGGLCHCRGAS